MFPTATDPPTTLIAAIRRWFEVDDVALRFWDHRGEVHPITRRHLDRRARAVAQHLAQHVGVGQRALILCPAGLDFVAAFLGCVYAGVVAVPAPPPQQHRPDASTARLEVLAARAGATHVLSTTALDDMLRQALPRLGQLPRTLVDQIDEQVADGWRMPRIGADDLAFLQYTSGSTAAPRGVRLTHRNLLANQEHISAVRGPGPAHAASWLPPFHDMGLIGGILHPLTQGFPGVLMAPTTFLRHPLRWLQAISTHRVTISPAPNFALDLCVRRAARDGVPALDLSSLTCLILGAEPIRAASLDRFAEAFAPVGFRPEAFYPCFGLAEGTLLCSGPRATPRPRRHQGRVSCGRPVGPHRIVRPETGEEAPDGALGEVWLKGPHVAAGYDGDDDATAHTFDGGGAGWLRTGDLGFVHGDELFLAGRLKDLIVHRGRNLHPADLEATLASHPQVRPGGLAVVSVDEDDEERIVLLAEVDLSRGDLDATVLIAALRHALDVHHQVPVHQVVLLAPRALPKTTSGKVQRRAARAAWRSGSLPLARLPSRAGEPVPASVPARSSLYPALQADRLDARSDAYRYDLERDVPWHQLHAPGTFFPESVAADAWPEALPLRRDPHTWDQFQRAAALALCEVFVHLETDLQRFLHAHGDQLGPHRSLTLLDEEEDKHSAMFRRFADALTVDDLPLRALARDAAQTRWDELVRTPSTRDAATHYRFWLGVILFEEWTVWFYEQLQAAASEVQPLWLAIHRLHAREEVQHLRTDSAWLDGLDLPEATRRDLSRQVLTETLAPMRITNQVIADVFAQRLPDVPLTRASTSQHLLTLLRSRTLRRTRRHAPFFAEIADRALPTEAPPPTVAQPPTEAQALSWLRQWAGEALGRAPDGLDPTVPLTELGLDSADLLGLSGALEDWLGARFGAALPYELPTLQLLAGYLSTLSRRVAAGVGVDHGVSTRQRRWLDLARAAGGLAHSVTEVYRFREPPDEAALERALTRTLQAHVSLRTRFEHTAEGWQRREGPAPRWQRVQAAHLETGLREHTARLYRTPFDPEQGPLARAVLVHAPDGCGMVLSLAHVLADGVAMAVWVHDLAGGLQGPLEPAPDPAASDEASITDDHLAWWTTRLPIDPSPPRPARFDGHRLVRRIDADTGRAWFHDRPVGPFAVLLAAWMRSWRDVFGAVPPVGTQLARRGGGRRDRTVGYLVDVALVVADLPEASSLSAAAQQVHQAWLEALQHHVCVDALVARLAPERWHERWLPAPISLNYLPAAADAELPFLRDRSLLPATRSFLFYEAMLIAQQAPGGGLTLSLWYDRQVADEARAERLFDRLLHHLGRP